jgi:succinate-acetate transporter protein
VAIALLVFAVPLQFLSSTFGYLGRDGSGGTALALLGSCWLVVGGLTLRAPPGSRSATLGLLLLFASAALLVPVMASALGKVAAALAFLVAAARFAVAGIYEFRGGVFWEHLSGWLGLAVCIVALYNAFAFELEDMRHRTVLPVLRWGSGRRAMAGDREAEVEHVGHEAGVREQL